jgi:hypothetical protein
MSILQQASRRALPKAQTLLTAILPALRCSVRNWLSKGESLTKRGSRHDNACVYNSR